MRFEYTCHTASPFVARETERQSDTGTPVTPSTRDPGMHVKCQQMRTLCVQETTSLFPVTQECEAMFLHSSRSPSSFYQMPESYIRSKDGMLMP